MSVDLAMTRRGLLGAGIVGTAIVCTGGLIGCATRRVASPSVGMPVDSPIGASASELLSTPRVALTSTGEEIVRAVMPVVLGSLLPEDAAVRRQAMDNGITRLDDYLAHLSLPLQNEARDVFETLDLLPTRVFVVGTWSRWSEASPQTIESFLRSARQSRFELLRRMFSFLQSLAVLAWFDQREAWPAIGYPGPPIERPAPGEVVA